MRASLFHQAEAELRRAEAELRSLREFVTPEEKVVAERAVTVASARRDLAAQRLQDMRLLVPCDGTVLEILRRQGESVSDVGREPVILFGDISRLRVRAEIDERYLDALQIGQKATVTGRALGGKEYFGYITQIKKIMGKKSVFTRNSSEKRDLDIVQIFLQMEEGFEAPAGLRVDVAIPVDGDRASNGVKGDAPPRVLPHTAFTCRDSSPTAGGLFMERHGSKAVAILMLITGVGVAVYWLLVALGLFGEPSLLTWIRKFPYTSPIADTLMMVGCIAYYVYWKKGDLTGYAWGIAGATTMVYVSLIAFSFLLAHWPDELGLGILDGMLPRP